MKTSILALALFAALSSTVSAEKCTQGLMYCGSSLLRKGVSVSLLFQLFPICTFIHWLSCLTLVKETIVQKLNKSYTTSISLATSTTFRTVFSSAVAMDGLVGRTTAALGVGTLELVDRTTARVNGVRRYGGEAWKS